MYNVIGRVSCNPRTCALLKMFFATEWSDSSQLSTTTGVPRLDGVAGGTDYRDCIKNGRAYRPGLIIALRASLNSE